MITTAVVTTEVQRDDTLKRRYLGVITMPGGQVIPFVEFPQNPSIDIPPVNSIVLIMVHGSFNASYICKLVDPNNSTSRDSLPLPANGKPFIETGEQQISASSGASIFLNNAGGIHLTAANVKDEIVIDNDTIKAQATSIDVHSVPKALVAQGFLVMNSTLGLDNPLGVDRVIFGIRNPQTGISMYTVSVDALGEIILKNTVIGGSIVIALDGSVTIASPNKVTLAATSVAIDALSVSVNSPSISLGGPTGQKLATEFFVKTLYDQHTHTSNTVGNPTSVPLIPAGLIPGALTVVTSSL